MNIENLKVKSLAKAMRVLECFMKEPELGVTQLSQQLGLNKSNVHDILTTFEALGYVAQDARSGKYHFGYRVLELSHSYSSSMGWRKTVYPHMKQLSEAVGEVVYLAVPDGFDVIYLDAAYPTHEPITRVMLGDRAEMYCTGIGKAMLSQMDESCWEQLFSQPLKAYTASTLVEAEQIKQDLRLTRQRGYAVDNMEHELGIRCVGVPILNRFGAVVAGMSISCPSPRMNDEQVASFAAQLQRTAKLVSVYF